MPQISPIPDGDAPPEKKIALIVGLILGGIVLTIVAFCLIKSNVYTEKVWQNHAKTAETQEEIKLIHLLSGMQGRDCPAQQLETALAPIDNVNLIYKGQTPLNIAVNNKDFSSVKTLLASKANPDLNGICSALRIAVRRRHTPLVNLLLKNGANPNPSDSDQPLLFECLQSCYVGGLKALLNHGCDPNLQTEAADGMPPLFYAVMHGKKNTYQMCEILLNAGASPHSTFTSAGKSGREKVTDNLLTWAITRSNDENLILRLAQTLIAKNPDILQYMRPETGTTPLLLAVINNKEALVKILLDGGADPNPPSLKKPALAPLTAAISEKNIAIINLLLNAGARVNDAVTVEELTVYPLNQLLATKKWRHGQLTRALNLMFKNGADPTLCDKHFSPIWTLLHDHTYLASDEKLICVNLLIKHKADVKAYPEGQASPLELALFYTEQTETAIAESLLDAGAGINAADSVLKEPLLILACVKKNTQAIKLLLKHGADPDTQCTKEGLPALAYAMVSTENNDPGILECVSLLVKAGANTKDPAVQTCARNCKNYEVRRLLLGRPKNDLEKISDDMDASELSEDPFAIMEGNSHPPILLPGMAFGNSAAGKKSVTAINEEMLSCNAKEKSLLRDLKLCIKALYRLKATAAVHNQYIKQEQKKIAPLLRWADKCSKPNALGYTSPEQEAQARQKALACKQLIEMWQNETAEAVKAATRQAYSLSEKLIKCGRAKDAETLKKCADYFKDTII